LGGQSQWVTVRGSVGQGIKIKKTVQTSRTDL